LRAAGFTEVYQGTEHVYGSIQREDESIRKAQEFAHFVLFDTLPRLGIRNPDVRVIGCFDPIVKN